jgi:lambda family phage tail tape measure protein
LASKDLTLTLKVKDDGSAVVNNASKKMQNDLGNIDKSTKSTTTSFGNLTTSVTGFVKAAGAITVVTAAVGLLAQQFKGFINYASALKDVSENLGIAVEVLDKLKQAGESEGVGFDQITGSIERLQKGLYDARQDGIQPLEQAFQALGISMDGISKLDIVDKLKMIGVQLGQVRDQNDKVAITQEIFGRANVDLIRVIEELEEKLKSTSTTMTTEAATAVDDFQKSWVKLSNKLKEDILPVFTTIIELINKSLTLLDKSRSKVDQHRQFFADRTKDDGNTSNFNVPPSIAPLGLIPPINAPGYKTADQIAKEKEEALKEQKKLADEAKKLAEEELQQRIELLAYANEQAAAYALDQFEAQKRAYDDLLELQKTVKVDSFEANEQFYESDLEQLNQYYDKQIELAQENADLEKQIEENRDNSKRNLRYRYGEEQKPFFDQLKESMKDLDKEANKLYNTLGDTFTGSFVQNMTNGLTSIIDGTKSVKDAFIDMAKGIIDQMMQIATQMMVMKIVAGIGGAVSGAGGGGNPVMGGSGPITYTANGGAFSGGRLMAFANGGVVNRPTLFPMANGMGLMGEAGPEAVMPLSRGEDGKLGVKSDGGSGGGNHYTININAVDAKSFAQLCKSNPQAIIAPVTSQVEKGNKSLISTLKKASR